MQNKKMFITFILLTLFWMGVIFALSNTPANKSDQNSKAIIKTVISKKSDNELTKETMKDIDKKTDDINPIFRKVAHIVVYLILSILVILTIISINKDKWYIYNIGSLLICFLYACSDEYHQTFIAGRSGEVTDVFIDLLGALIGCIIFSLVYENKIKNNFS